VAAGVLFGVTEEDVATLSEDDFNAVWSALGKVARARSLAKQARAATPPRPSDVEGPGPDDDDESEDA
jgi:hypothetical protein